MRSLNVAFLDAISYLHSVTNKSAMPSSETRNVSVTLTFLVSLVGMGLLFVTLCKYEMASKNATMKLRSLKRRLAGDDDFGSAASARSAAPQL